MMTPSLPTAHSPLAPVRLLFIAPWVVEGGADRAIVDWFQYLDGQRYEKFLITTLVSRNPWMERVRPFAHEVWDLPSMNFSDPEMEDFILDFVVRKGIAAVHVMNSPHGFRVLPRLKALPKAPLTVTQFHTFDFTRDNQRAGWVVDAPKQWDSQIDAYVVSADYLRRYLTSELGISPERVRLIYNGINAEDYARDSISANSAVLRHRKSGKLNILFVGRLDRQKNPVLAAEVLHHLKRNGVPAFLHVIGDALLESERAELENFIKKHRLGHDCVLYGAQTDVRPWYLMADVALLTSRWEGVPYFLGEAMALGIPVVAPAVGGITEIVTPETGVLIQRREDAGEYAAALAHLAADSERRQALARAGRRRIEQNFSVKTMAELYDRLYRELLPTASAEIPESRGTFDLRLRAVSAAVPEGPTPANRLPETPKSTRSGARRASIGAEVYLSPDEHGDVLRAADTRERFTPLRTQKGITSAEHLARYLWAANFCHGKRVLDIACGVGYGSYLLKRAGAASVLGVDYSAEAITLASRAYRHADLAFLQADAYHFAEPEKFNLIVSFETIEHLEDPDSFLQRLVENLRVGGRVLLSCPNDAINPWKSPFHAREYSYDEFVSLLKRHFPHVSALGQVHTVASVIGDTILALDDLQEAKAGQYFWDAARAKQNADSFLAVCTLDAPAVEDKTLVVASKNLTTLLLELQQAVDFHHQQADQLRTQVLELQQAVDFHHQQADHFRTQLVDLSDRFNQLLEEKKAVEQQVEVLEKKLVGLLDVLENAAREHQEWLEERNRLYGLFVVRLVLWIRRRLGIDPAPAVPVDSSRNSREPR